MSFDPTQVGTLWVFDFKTMPLPSFSPADLVCRQLATTEADLMQQVMDKAGNYPPQSAAQRLSNNREGFIGAVQTDTNPALMPVTYGWLAFNSEPLGDSGWAFATPPGDMWMYDFATVPDFRGHGYYPMLLRFILHKLAERGVGRAWIGTAPGNDKSARSIGRAGFQKIGDTKIVFSPQSQPINFEIIPAPGVSQELVALGKATHVRR